MAKRGIVSAASAVAVTLILTAQVLTGERAGAQDSRQQAGSIAAAGAPRGAESVIPCIDPPTEPPNSDPRPVWIELAPPGGTGYPDYKNVTDNLQILKSIRLAASIATRAAHKLNDLTSEHDPEAKGRCVCALGTSAGDPPFEVYLDVERQHCTEDLCMGVQGEDHPIWLPTDLFKSGGNVAKFALNFFDFLDEVKDKLGDFADVLEQIGSGLDNFGDLVEKLQEHVDEFTEGYHLGGYSHQRPDLHVCVGYGGDKAMAEMLNLFGEVSIGGGYKSYNLSKEHRAQYRSGGFAVEAFGKQLNILPGVEANVQIDGFRMWDVSNPFGIDLSQYSGLGLPGCTDGPGFLVTEEAIELYDIFHLLNSPDELLQFETSGDGCLQPAEFLIRNYYPATYTSDGFPYIWPRPAFEIEDWERQSTAVFSAGLNLSLKAKRLEKCLPPGPPNNPCPGPGIPLFPGAKLFPKLTLDAGVAWTHEAYGLRDRVQEMANVNLTADPQLEVTDFERGMHDLQAPDSSEDNGTSAYVRPRVAADLLLGFDLSSFLRLGITATLGTSVRVEPGAKGGLIDFNTALAEVLLHSNPPKDLPCDPILERKQTSQCTNYFEVDEDGYPLSSGEYSCDVDEVFEYRCKAPENDIACDPENAAEDCPETQECLLVYGCAAHGYCERPAPFETEYDTTYAACSGETVCQQPAINAGVSCESSDDCPAPSTCISGKVGEVCTNDAECAEDTCERVWIPTFGGSAGMNSGVRTLTVFDGQLIAGGAFITAGGETVNRIAKWDGTEWSDLGGGMNGPVLALTVFNGALYAGGDFTTAGGEPASRVAKWNGTEWLALGSGMNANVDALTVFDGHLVAGGSFTTAGGAPANFIAKWDGITWSTLGSGVNNTVGALTVFDGDLIAGGDFSVARWNGAGWSPLGSGMNEAVDILTVFDGHLIAGGHFTTADGVVVNHIARWDGAAWSALGSGMNGNVWGLTVFDGDLIAGGLFTTADVVPASYVAKWDGTSWSALGAGTNGNVFNLTVFDGYLIAGGLFTMAGHADANRVARWGCPFPGECEEATAPCEQTGPAGYFTPYDCLVSNRPEIVGWEGPGCHPLTVGFASACGCKTDEDCVAGIETCIDGACAVADEAVACACDPSDASPCSDGRVCVEGACLLECVTNGDADCAAHQTCDDGVCVNPYGIVFAEQVVWKVRNVPSPQHAIHTYGFSEILTSVILDASVRIGLDLKIFKKLKRFTLVELSKDWVLAAFNKAWYQAGLEARYQNDCDPVAGGITNWQPEHVTRYNPFAASSGSLGNAGDEEDLLDWCFDTLPNDVSDPQPPTTDNLTRSITDTIEWGEDIGIKVWELGGVCVTQVINGEPVSTPFTQWMQNLNADASGLQCSYISGTQTDVFPCEDLQNHMLLTWGCLNTDASPWAALLAGAFPGKVASFNGTPVFELDQMLIDPTQEFTLGNVRPEIRTYPGGLGWVGHLWYAMVSACFDANYAAMQPGDLALADVDFGPCCGNGVLDQQGCADGAGPCEECDDGDNLAGDGCSSLCRVEVGVPLVGCGDGIVQIGMGEECDDGNEIAGDGCEPDCTLTDDCCCEGDVDGNGVIDETDVQVMIICLNGGSCGIDVNCDGASDVLDLNGVSCLSAGFTERECCACDQEPEPGVCPGDEPCGLAHGTPGCNDGECCETVCAADPTCCAVGWGAHCVALAADLCVCVGVCEDGAWCYDPGGDPGFDCCGVGNCPCIEPTDPLSQDLCGEECEAEWLPAFGSASGMNNSVSALTVFNGHLVAGGSFITAGGLPAGRIAKWDGTEWSALGSGMDDKVDALTEFDGHLIAGGSFSTAGGVPASRIANWDGAAWSPLGSGIDLFVHALTVFDGHLVAGGTFFTAGGVGVSHIAKWDGTEWSPLGSGMNNSVWALTVFDDGSGSGPALYAGGPFTTAGGVPADYIAKWDGTEWSALGSGTDNAVSALAVFEDGLGGEPALYAGGIFTTAGGLEASRMAKWGCVASPEGSCADIDGDGVVDWVDFALFAACDTGPAVPYDPQNLPLACTLVADAQGIIPADFDFDGDVDLEDFAWLQRCSPGGAN